MQTTYEIFYQKQNLALILAAKSVQFRQTQNLFGIQLDDHKFENLQVQYYWIYGCHCLESEVKIFICQPAGVNESYHKFRFKEMVFIMQDASTARALRHAILEHAFAGPRQRLTILLNPFTGRGRAVRAWQKECQAIFEKAPLDLKIITTQNAAAAYDFGRNIDANTCDGIVCVGGDGLFNETINGMLDRPDWQNIIEQVTLSSIAGGTGNGICASLGTLDRRLASFLIIKGFESPLDIFSLRFSSGRRRFGCLSFNFCMIGDIEHKQEAYRWMPGYLRYYYTILLVLLKRATYSLRFEYLLESDFDLPAQKIGTVQEGSHLPARPFPPPDPNLHHNPRFGPMDVLLATRQSGIVNENQKTNPDSVQNSNRVTVQCSTTTVFCTSSLPELDRETHFFPAKHNDGLLHTLVAGNIGRGQLLNMFLKLQSEAHLTHPGIMYIKSRALIIEAEDPIGYLNVDGENLAYSKRIGIEMHPGLLRLRGVHPV